MRPGAAISSLFLVCQERFGGSVRVPSCVLKRPKVMKTRLPSTRSHFEIQVNLSENNLLRWSGPFVIGPTPFVIALSHGKHFPGRTKGLAEARHGLSLSSQVHRSGYYCSWPLCEMSVHFQLTSGMHGQTERVCLFCLRLNGPNEESEKLLQHGIKS